MPIKSILQESGLTVFDYQRDITIAEIQSLLPMASPSILEIGAWEGDTTEKLLQAMPRAYIMTFEPDPRPLVALKARFAQRMSPSCLPVPPLVPSQLVPEVTCYFDGLGAVVVVPTAVGAVTGPVPWYASHGSFPGSCCDGDWSLSSSLRQPTHHLQRSPEITFDQRTVGCLRLDDWMTLFATGYDLFTRFDFAWIDVQGAQRDVIAGGFRVLDITPLIYIELHNTPEYEGEPTFEELCALLPNHTPRARFGENVLFERV